MFTFGYDHDDDHDDNNDDGDDNYNGENAAAAGEKAGLSKDKDNSRSFWEALRIGCVRCCQRGGSGGCFARSDPRYDPALGYAVDQKKDKAEDEYHGCYSKRAVCVRNPFRLRVGHVVRSIVFQLVIYLIVLYNTVTISVQYYGMSTSMSDWIYASTLCCTALFLAEGLLKLYGLGPYEYFRSGYNLAEAAVTIGALIEAILTDGVSISALHVLRFIRLFEEDTLLKAAKDYRAWQLLRKQEAVQRASDAGDAAALAAATAALAEEEEAAANANGGGASWQQSSKFIRTKYFIRTIVSSAKDTFYCICILIAFIFFAAVIGRSFLEGKMVDLDGFPVRNNFNSFFWSCVTVFQVMTPENWNTVLYDAKHAVGWPGAIFILGIFLLGFYIMMSLFLAVMVVNFDVQTEEGAQVADEEKERKDQEVCVVLAATVTALSHTEQLPVLYHRYTTERATAPALAGGDSRHITGLQQQVARRVAASHTHRGSAAAAAAAAGHSVYGANAAAGGSQFSTMSSNGAGSVGGHRRRNGNTTRQNTATGSKNSPPPPPPPQQRPTTSPNSNSSDSGSTAGSGGNGGGTTPVPLARSPLGMSFFTPPSALADANSNGGDSDRADGDDDNVGPMPRFGAGGGGSGGGNGRPLPPPPAPPAPPGPPALLSTAVSRVSVDHGKAFAAATAAGPVATIAASVSDSVAGLEASASMPDSGDGGGASFASPAASHAAQAPIYDEYYLSEHLDDLAALPEPYVPAVVPSAVAATASVTRLPYTHLAFHNHEHRLTRAESVFGRCCSRLAKTRSRGQTGHKQGSGTVTASARAESKTGAPAAGGNSSAAAAVVGAGGTGSDVSMSGGIGDGPFTLIDGDVAAGVRKHAWEVGRRWRRLVSAALSSTRAVLRGYGSSDAQIEEELENTATEDIVKQHNVNVYNGVVSYRDLKYPPGSFSKLTNFVVDLKVYDKSRAKLFGMDLTSELRLLCIACANSALTRTDFESLFGRRFLAREHAVIARRLLAMRSAAAQAANAAPGEREFALLCRVNPWELVTEISGVFGENEEEEYIDDYEASSLHGFPGYPYFPEDEGWLREEVVERATGIPFRDRPLVQLPYMLGAQDRAAPDSGSTAGTGAGTGSSVYSGGSSVGSSTGAPPELEHRRSLIGGSNSATVNSLVRPSFGRPSSLLMQPRSSLLALKEQQQGNGGIAPALLAQAQAQGNGKMPELLSASQTQSAASFGATPAFGRQTSPPPLLASLSGSSTGSGGPPPLRRQSTHARLMSSDMMFDGEMLGDSGSGPGYGLYGSSSSLAGAGASSPTMSRGGSSRRLLAVNESSSAGMGLHVTSSSVGSALTSSSTNITSAGDQQQQQQQDNSHVAEAVSAAVAATEAINSQNVTLAQLSMSQPFYSTSGFNFNLSHTNASMTLPGYAAASGIAAAVHARWYLRDLDDFKSGRDVLILNGRLVTPPAPPTLFPGQTLNSNPDSVSDSAAAAAAAGSPSSAATAGTVLNAAVSHAIAFAAATHPRDLITPFYYTAYIRGTRRLERLRCALAQARADAFPSPAVTAASAALKADVIAYLRGKAGLSTLKRHGVNVNRLRWAVHERRSFSPLGALLHTADFLVGDESSVLAFNSPLQDRQMFSSTYSHYNMRLTSRIVDPLNRLLRPVWDVSARPPRSTVDHASPYAALAARAKLRAVLSAPHNEAVTVAWQVPGLQTALHGGAPHAGGSAGGSAGVGSSAYNSMSSGALTASGAASPHATTGSHSTLMRRGGSAYNVNTYNGSNGGTFNGNTYNGGTSKFSTKLTGYVNNLISDSSASSLSADFTSDAASEAERILWGIPSNPAAFAAATAAARAAAYGAPPTRSSDYSSSSASDTSMTSAGPAFALGAPVSALLAPPRVPVLPARFGIQYAIPVPPRRPVDKKMLKRIERRETREKDALEALFTTVNAVRSALGEDELVRDLIGLEAMEAAEHLHEAETAAARAAAAPTAAAEVSKTAVAAATAGPRVPATPTGGRKLMFSLDALPRVLPDDSAAAQAEAEANAAYAAAAAEAAAVSAAAPLPLQGSGSLTQQQSTRQASQTSGTPSLPRRASTVTGPGASAAATAAAADAAAAAPSTTTVLHPDDERLLMDREPYCVCCEASLPPAVRDCVVRLRYRDYNFGFISRSHPSRRYALQLVLHPAFELTFMVLIFFSCVVLALDHPDVHAQSRLGRFVSISNWFITIVFALEILLKIWAHGLILNINAYLQDGWNVFDFIAVVVSTISFFVRSTRFAMGLRSLRGLRALRFVSYFESTREVASGIGKAFVACIPIFLFGLLLFVLYGSLGVAFFKGKLRRCYDPFSATPLEELPFDEISCLAQNFIWRNPFAFGNFDSLGAAFLVLFEFCTMEGWPGYMYLLADATPVGMQPKVNYNPYNALYVVFAIILFGFFYLNLFIGTIVDSFDSSVATDLNELQVAWLQTYRLILDHRPVTRLLEPRTGPIDDADSSSSSSSSSDSSDNEAEDDGKGGKRGGKSAKSGAAITLDANGDAVITRAAASAKTSVARWQRSHAAVRMRRAERESFAELKRLRIHRRAVAHVARSAGLHLEQYQGQSQSAAATAAAAASTEANNLKDAVSAAVNHSSANNTSAAPGAGAGAGAGAGSARPKVPAPPAYFDAFNLHSAHPYLPNTNYIFDEEALQRDIALPAPADSRGVLRLLAVAPVVTQETRMLTELLKLGQAQVRILVLIHIDIIEKHMFLNNSSHIS